MALNINGRMKVKTLRSEFKTEFGLTLRIYDGRSFADDDSTLASIRKGDSKGGEFSPKRNTKVETFEIKMMNMFGIKVQVAGSDDSYLCNDVLTIAGAQEQDKLKMEKKEKKALRTNNQDNVATQEINDNMSNFDLLKVFDGAEFSMENIKIGYTQGEIQEDYDDYEDGFRGLNHVDWKFSILYFIPGTFSLILIDWNNNTVQKFDKNSDGQIYDAISTICSSSTEEMFGATFPEICFKSVLECVSNDGEVPGYASEVLDQIGGDLLMYDGSDDFIDQEYVNALFAMQEVFADETMSVKNNQLCVNEEEFDIDEKYDNTIVVDRKYSIFTEDVMKMIDA